MGDIKESDKPTHGTSSSQTVHRLNAHGRTQNELPKPSAGSPAAGTILPKSGRDILKMQTLYNQEVADAALAVLAKSSISELRQLRVDEAENELRLSGQVKSYYHKQIAQETIRPVAAGMLVVNEVDVLATVVS